MTNDMTQGKILPILIKFTIPLVLGNLLQLTYNAVDSIIVGHVENKVIVKNRNIMYTEYERQQYFREVDVWGFISTVEIRALRGREDHRSI